LPQADTEAMQLQLEETLCHVAEGAHAKDCKLQWSLIGHHVEIRRDGMIRSKKKPTANNVVDGAD
jgi:hypothetical protein